MSDAHTPFIAMVKLRNERQPMLVTACKKDAVCANAYYCDCMYTEGRDKPRYPVPTTIVREFMGKRNDCLFDRGTIVAFIPLDTPSY